MQVATISDRRSIQAAWLPGGGSYLDAGIRRAILSGALLLASATLASASQTARGAPAPDSGPREAFAAWSGGQPAGWSLSVDPETGFGGFLHGRGAAPGALPRDDSEWFELARGHLVQTREVTGLDVQTLAEGSVLFLSLGPPGHGGTSDKWTVELLQRVDGVPVEGGRVSALFSERGELLAIDSVGLPEARLPAVTPQVEAGEALDAAARSFMAETGLAPSRIERPELVIAQIVEAGARSGALAWRVEILSSFPDSTPDGRTVWVDALRGDVLRSRSNVHDDVSGVVRSNATPGDAADTAGNPPQELAMPHLEVFSTQGSADTDGDGNFVISGASAPLDLTVRYEGPFATVVNAAGGNHVLTQPALADSGNELVMNPVPTEFVTAQANAFYWINQLRDWIRTTNPSDGIADFQALANVNLPAPCNAFWTSAGGGSVNFFAETTCPNSAYSSVVMHEMGHWLNERYGSGNGGDGFGEGNADVYAMYRLDTPVVARDFFGPGQHIRDGRNLRQFCGDANPGCYGEVHTDGEVLMGALWKVRAALQGRHGVQQGGLIADHLFNAWMNAFNDGAIRSIIETHWLVLDDDDGNLDNGTPNYSEIDGAFRIQGFPGVDVSCPPPTTYCVGAANSAGPGARIGQSGTSSHSANDLVLHVAGTPPNKFGMFFYGGAETQLAFGNGFRCIAGALVRLPAQQTDPSGTASFPLDLDDLPNGGQIGVGDLVRFQFWYRDPMAGGAAYNLSDALRVEFCP